MTIKQLKKLISHLDENIDIDIQHDDMYFQVEDLYEPEIPDGYDKKVALVTSCF